MDAGSLNEKRTALLIDHLIAQGIDQFCLSPGSRSTSLALAVAEHPRAQSDVHFDERGLAFYALGKAKGSRKPVAIIVTSGTAVGNLLPAVMEASNDHVPLIVITADRPNELRNCSANQTCDQVKLFTPYVRFQADLPFSDPRFPETYLAASIGQAVYLSTLPRPGPVHLNCMLRKPYFSTDFSHVDIDDAIEPRLCMSGEIILSQETITSYAARLAQVKQGLIIVGALPHDTAIDPIFMLAKKLGWPIYADILSQLRSKHHSHLIRYFDLIVQAGHHSPVDAVLHFGTVTVSRSVSEWLKKIQPSFYLHISDYPTLMDPHYIVTHRLHASSMRCARALAEGIAINPEEEWLRFWKEVDAVVEEQLFNFFASATTITEPGIIHHIGKHIENASGLFVANSMPIRDADKFFSPSRDVPLFGNRGVSGIDGNIATVIGIAQGMQKPLIALLGDLAFLHDMNSLSLLNNAPYPVCFIIVNNAGGGIFSFLSVSEKKKAFEKFFACAHSYSFAHAAALFNLDYAQPQKPEELDALLCAFSSKTRSILLEIRTDRTENVHVHEQITAAIKQAIVSCKKVFIEAMACR